MKTIYLIYLSIIVLFITTCIKDEQKTCPTDFRVYGEVTPYDSVYHIGDTLTLKCDYHYMVYEENTKNYYNLKGVNNIEASISIFNLDTICESLDYRMLDFVDIVPSDIYDYNIQTFSKGNMSLYSNIILKTDTFKNEVKIIFKEKGLYMLAYGPRSIENKSYFEEKCNLVSFNLFPRLNSNLDNNINLLALSPDEHFSNWILIQHPNDNFYNRGCFAYKVE